ncbi:DUF3644 domain-containing protein [Dolosigranulum pigrum]|uniref:DUF3644 domain-containing protein n=1 Tax=Dolosigranulum pigrum TaxID=29394 RepID=UPI00248A98D9|nr:DUF3644 domain-containing protein [Dolosigranulum pigrum]
MTDLTKQLVDKSIEAFIMGLEIYNKPTIKYRIEGFSFFICNAWELMLKAELLNRGETIYYPNSDTTISLSETVSKIYTDVNQPLRKNIEEIIALRNIATHFITEDDEVMYAPFFQSNVLSFSEQVERFHNIKIINHIPQNFLTLSVSFHQLTDEEIKRKYSSETAKNFIYRRNNLEELKNTTSSNDLYIPLRIELYQTKQPETSDLSFAVDNQAEDKMGIVKVEIDPKNKYNLTRKNVIAGVNKQLKAKNILFHYTAADGKSYFNSYTLNLIDNYYNLSGKLAYQFGHSKRYSQQFVDEIVVIIQGNPDVIEHIKNKKR